MAEVDFVYSIDRFHHERIVGLPSVPCAIKKKKKKIQYNFLMVGMCRIGNSTNAIQQKFTQD